MEKRKSSNFLNEFIPKEEVQKAFDSIGFVKPIIDYLQKRLMLKLYLIGIERKLLPYSASFIFFQQHLLLIQDQSFYRKIDKNDKFPKHSIEPKNSFLDLSACGAASSRQYSKPILSLLNIPKEYEKSVAISTLYQTMKRPKASTIEKIMPKVIFTRKRKEMLFLLP